MNERYKRVGPGNQTGNKPETGGFSRSKTVREEKEKILLLLHANLIKRRRMKKILTSWLILTFSVLSGAPFDWSADTGSDNHLIIRVTVEENYYLYAESLIFTVSGGNSSPLSPVSQPRSISHNDEISGPTEIYPAGTWSWEWRGEPPYSATVEYQGCRKATGDEPAMCLMPQEVALLPGGTVPAEELAGAIDTLPIVGADFRLERRSEGLLDARAFLAWLRADDKAARSTGSVPSEGGILVMLLLALFGGLALNLTPCVLPMIPVNLMIIGAGESRRAGFQRGLLYGIGMAGAYGGLGAAVVLAGGSLRFGELNSSSVFNFVIAGIFLVLAAAMSGLFNLDLSGKFHIKPSALKTSKNLAALLLGAVAALLAGACVAPVVISVLLFAAERYNSGNGLAPLLPLALGIGMALPWPLAGAGMSVLPKPGRFMNAVKYLFAVVILGVAVYYGWTGWNLLPGKYDPAAEVAKLEAAMALACREGKPLLVDFWASWCKNCKEMEHGALADPEVQGELRKFVVTKFQAEKLSDPAVAALLDRWEIRGLPAFVILSPPDVEAGEQP